MCFFLQGYQVDSEMNSAHEYLMAEVQISEEEIGNLPEKGFRIMTVKMIKNLENKMEKMQESINKDLEELKNKHTDKQHNYWNKKYSGRTQ